jgi:hypothetical protein
MRMLYVLISPLDPQARKAATGEFDRDTGCITLVNRVGEDGVDGRIGSAGGVAGFGWISGCDIRLPCRLLQEEVM